MEETEAPKKRVLSDEQLEKLAKARELANAKRKEMAEQRRADKEALVQQKMEEAKVQRTEKLEKQATREAKKRVSSSKAAVVVEYSSSDSDDFDLDTARVLFVKKDRPKKNPVPKPIAPAPDPLAGAYRRMFEPRF